MAEISKATPRFNEARERGIEMKTRVGLIRVLTTKDENVLKAHGRLLEARFPEFQVESRCIDDQPEGIYDEKTSAIALPKIITLGEEMEREGMEALIVSCADDPGVGELRKIVKIPVVGAGSSCASVALSCGGKIGTLGIRERAPRIMRDILGDHLVAQTRPGGVKTTLDLMTREGRENALRAAQDLRSKGAEVIALACTGYATIGIAKDLETAAGIPVVEAVEAAGLFAWHLAMGR
jgi:Asp/Glu/hydantoin racemase